MAGSFLDLDRLCFLVPLVPAFLLVPVLLLVPGLVVWAALLAPSPVGLAGLDSSTTAGGAVLSRLERVSLLVLAWLLALLWLRVFLPSSITLELYYCLRDTQLRRFLIQEVFIDPFNCKHTIRTRT